MLLRRRGVQPCRGRGRGSGERHQHRFLVGIVIYGGHVACVEICAASSAAAGGGEEVRFAYADPPYIGQAKRHYNCPEIDHVVLIATLEQEFPDGWALSASSPTLNFLLNLCTVKVRVGVWCKSFCAFKRGVRPAYAWEPVIFSGGRNPMNGHRAAIPERNGKQLTPKDYIECPITLKKGLVGAKPEKVCRWILDLLNFQPGDELVDMFPGTGVMGRVAGEQSAQAGSGQANQRDGQQNS
jgi:hypothetical protein